MTTSNENYDPRSLLNLSLSPTHSGHKWNGKRKARKGSANPGLKESLLRNITSDSMPDCNIETRLCTPPSPQSMVGSHNFMEETRLPISPPPEEEIRIKELSTQGHAAKQLRSQHPVQTSSGASTIFGPALSFTEFQQQAIQFANETSDQGTDHIDSTFAGPLANPVVNPRKRTRSVTCTRQGSLTKRRPRVGRSATPEVPYEPPAEQFTPPRDVVLQIPSPAVSSRSRKPKTLTSTGANLSVDTKVVRIKTERLTSPFPLPLLDLSKPVPPPSPTDDPLLLVGPPVIVQRTITPSAVASKFPVNTSVGGEDVVDDGPSASICVSPTTIRHMDQTLCGFGPAMMDETLLMGAGFDGPWTFKFDSDSSDPPDGIGDDITHHSSQFASDPFAFGAEQSTGSQVFHSDDERGESGEDEGEFTGRFRFYSVPVERDPPSSATRARRESWGRPISPFPFAKRTSTPPSSKASTYVPPSHPVSPAHSISLERPVTSLPHFNANQASDHHEVFHDEPTRKLQEYRDVFNDDDSSDDDRPPTGVVEVSSDDPKAAARAAAILKLHHSYIVDGPAAQRARRRPHGLRRSFVAFNGGNMENEHDDESMRRARRKSIAASAGVMQHRPQSTVPSPIDALKEAEREIRTASASPGQPKTPCRSISRSVSPSTGSFRHSPSLYKNVEASTEVSPIPPENIKPWTKAHWRALDTCFTDERLSVGRAMGLENLLAEVDDVEIESVVERFLAQIDDDGEDWDQYAVSLIDKGFPDFITLRDMLLRRATALSARQRAGNGAPPSSKGIVHQNSSQELVGPVYTPLTASRTSSPEAEVGMSTTLPPSLLAPRYAHLHEDVTTSSLTATQISTSTPGYSTSEGNTTSKRNLNALLLPPPEMRQVVRGPINTPAKKPIPKSQHPRELVHLVETELPTNPIQFPKAKIARDMVNLNHVEPPRSVQRRRTVSGPIFIPGRNRKDSGGSVKDLVKSFEAVQKGTDEEITKSRSRLVTRKTASIGNLYVRSIWKP